MAEGDKEAKQSDLESATAKYQRIKDRYPYSKLALEAELKLADVLYERRLYEEAKDAYSEFERLHPTNPNVPYVIYQNGMCDFIQIDAIDRDQVHTQKAIVDFNRLVKRFPDSEYAARAYMKIRQCYINLAEYELYVGDFYFKQRKYRAAMGRYRYILENYPDLGQYHDALTSMSKAKRILAEAGPEQDESAESSKPWWRKLIPTF